MYIPLFIQSVITGLNNATINNLIYFAICTCAGLPTGQNTRRSTAQLKNMFGRFHQILLPPIIDVRECLFPHSLVFWKVMKHLGFCVSDRWEIVSQYSFYLDFSCYGQYKCNFSSMSEDEEPLLIYSFHLCLWFSLLLMHIGTSLVSSYSSVSLIFSFLFLSKFKYLSFLYFLARCYI